MDSAAAAGMRAARRAIGSQTRSDIASVQPAGLAGWAWLTVAWTAAGTMFYLLTPKIAPAIVALSLVAPLLSLGSETRHLRPFHASSLAIVLGLSALYLLINASWSLARPDAYRSVLTFIMVVGVLFIVVAAHRQLHEAALRAMLLGFLAGYIAGAALLCLLFVSDYAVLIWLMNALPPAWRYEVAWATLQGGNLVALPEQFLNRQAAGLVLLLWPAVLAAVTLSDSAKTRRILFLALTPAAAAILLSHHATSQVALIGGAAMVLLYRYAPRIGMRALTTAWVVACVAAVPIVFAMHAVHLQANEALFWSARHRLVIWHHTAQKIPEAPLLGAGVGTARAMDTLEQGTRVFEPGTQIPRETNIHAHNAYVQVWYEAGAIGVVLLLSVGLLTIGAISRTPPRVQSLLFAIFTSHALVAAFGFSVWAPWLLSSFVLAAIFASPSVVLAMRDADAA